MKRQWILALITCAALGVVFLGARKGVIDGRGLKVRIGGSDSTAIFLLLNSLEQAIHQNDTVRIFGILGPGIHKRKGKSVEGSPLEFRAKVSSIDLYQPEAARVFINCQSNSTAPSRDVVVELRKTNGHWSITNGDALVQFIPPRGAVPDGVGNNDALLSPLVSNDILIPAYHPGTLNLHKITKSIVEQELGVSLFATGAPMNMDAILQPESGYEVGFITDKIWRRIVYGSQDPENTWLKAYGINYGEADFSMISGFVIDPFDTLFVSDKHLGIFKLFYNRSQKAITSYSMMNIAGIMHPNDVSFDYGVNPCLPNDGDGLWISDAFTKRIVKASRSGQVVKEITHYTYLGTTYSLNKPSKVVWSNVGPPGGNPGDAFIAVLDVQDQYWPWSDYLITLDARSLNGTVATAVERSEFPGSANAFISLGIDVFGQFWVGDRLQKMYHLFTKYGRYLASTSSDPNGEPLAISRTQVRFAGACDYLVSLASISTADSWGEDTGLRYHFPGADIMNETTVTWFSPSGVQYQVFDWTGTNKSRVRAEVVDGNGNVVKTIVYADLEAGRMLYSVPATEMPWGDLTFRVTATPIFAPGGVVKEVPFHNHQPISLGLIQGPPNPLQQYQSYTFSVMPPTGGSPPFTYKWSTKLTCCPGTSGGDTPDECNNFTELVGFTSTSATISNGYNYTLNLLVTDAEGYTVSRSRFVDVQRCYPNPGGGGCPYLYTWNGSRFVEENNLLPQSEYSGNNGIDVTDRYKILRPPSPVDEEFILQIRENGQEHSTLDKVALVAVDHHPLLSVTMDEAGEVSAFIKPGILRRAQLRGRNVVRELRDFDSSTVTASAGDVLDLSFLSSGGNSQGDKLTINQLLKYGATTGEEGGVEGGGDVGVPVKDSPILVRTFGKGNQSTTLGMMYFRHKPSLVFLPLSLTDTTDLQLVWNNNVRVDYIDLARKVNVPLSVVELPLRNAFHSLNGIVTGNLRRVDSSYVDLMPNQHIELRFSVPSLPPTKSRTFFLVTRGRYNRIGDTTVVFRGRVNNSLTGHLPTAFHVSRNFPNPFNPTTQIRFDLPEESRVTLVVYDILGRQIAELANGAYEAGYHSVSWNASSFASGIYLARFVATDASGTVKLSTTQKLVLAK